jgi:hypothetical protein
MEVRTIRVSKPFLHDDFEKLVGQKVIFTFVDGEKMASEVKAFIPKFDNPEEECSLRLEDYIEVYESEIEYYEVVD